MTSDIQKENAMTNESTPKKESNKPRTIHHGGSQAVYGLGLIGAWVYYIGHATTFWIGVLGFLKGIVWPAMLVYEALKYLNM
jgi:hypothetical protein